MLFTFHFSAEEKKTEADPNEALQNTSLMSAVKDDTGGLFPEERGIPRENYDQGSLFRNIYKERNQEEDMGENMAV